MPCGIRDLLLAVIQYYRSVCPLCKPLQHLLSSARRLRTMIYLFTALTLFSLVSGDHYIQGASSTTRYWDCCKPSCGWPGKANVSQPVTSCDSLNRPLGNASDPSSCQHGTSYMCADQAPWEVNSTLAYGFAGVYFALYGPNEYQTCCACYELTFTSGSNVGRKMIIQATDTVYGVQTDTINLAVCRISLSFCDCCADCMLGDRSLEVVSAPNQAAVPSTAYRIRSGASRMAALLLNRAAKVSQIFFRWDVTGAFSGSEMLKTQRTTLKN